jgi:2-(1,2-epoxy-1,2-dihydrophenyl)acetyl-CoA isomerase
MAMSDSVLLNIDNHIATITLNRPQQMNTYNDHMSETLEKMTTQVMFDENVRAVVLCGAGKLFMAGGDISFFHEHLGGMSTVVDKIICQLNATVRALQTMPKPVIASVHGSVAGVGISLMLAADLVISATDTKFTTAYSKVGLSSDGGATYFLPRHVGTKKAMQLFLLAEQFDAKAAQEMGLINWIVDGTALDLETTKLAQRLANGPTQAYASMKKLVNQSHESTLAQQLEQEAMHFVKCCETQDFQAGVKGFMSKTAVVFEGQ